MEKFTDSRNAVSPIKRSWGGSWQCRRKLATKLLMKKSRNTFGRHSRAVKLSPGLFDVLGQVNNVLTIWFYSYGHGVLRNPDPRFIALQEFCESRPELKSSSIIELVNKVGSFLFLKDPTGLTLSLQDFPSRSWCFKGTWKGMLWKLLILL